MKLYRVSHYRTGDCQAGFSFYSRKDKAKQAMEEADDEVEEIEVEISKAGILKALNKYASHPDNG